MLGVGSGVGECHCDMDQTYPSTSAKYIIIVHMIESVQEGISVAFGPGNIVCSIISIICHLCYIFTCNIIQF